MKWESYYVKNCPGWLWFCCLGHPHTLTKCMINIAAMGIKIIKRSDITLKIPYTRYYAVRSLQLITEGYFMVTILKIEQPLNTE